MSLILVIDDSKILRFTVRKMFAFANYKGTILEFDNGKDAIYYLKENKNNKDNLPNYILLDINMPTMNGFEFLEAYSHLAPFYQEIPISILSSSIDPSDQSKAKRYKNVQSFIVKPLSHQSVQEIIDAIS